MLNITQTPLLVNIYFLSGLVLYYLSYYVKIHVIQSYFFLFAFEGARDYAFPIEMEDIATFRTFCKTRSVTDCEEPLQSTLFWLLESIGRMPPETVDDAKELLQWLTKYFH